MPIFEFICSSCGNLFDDLATAEQQVAVCDNCGEMASRRNAVERVSRPSITYEGPMVNMPTVSDKEMDRRVGFTSEKNWQTYEQQKTRIDSHRKDTGNPHVTIDGSGNPTELSKEELEYRTQIQEVMDKGKIVESYAESDDGQRVPIQKPRLVKAKKPGN
jgi:putative FmdB family regulatory protein